jgi:membrane associated rhomboid family serine protease
MGKIQREANNDREVLFLGYISNWLDRFCYKHPRFGIPNLMFYIIAGNILVYMLDHFSGNTFSQSIAFIPYDIIHGQIWRLVTFVFIPVDESNIFFLAINCYFYYFIGNMLEREWSNGKFTMFYLVGVLFNILAGFIIALIYGGFSTPEITTNMFFVNMSLLFAFATLFPNLQLLLFFIIPIKAKWMAWIAGALYLIEIVPTLIQGSFAILILPVVALLNYLIFFWGDLSYVFKKVKRRTSPQVMNFKKAQKKAKETKGYLHKCAVCGITDTERPDMEFRYCSKCNGYYCYCMDHINSHVHVE